MLAGFLDQLADWIGKSGGVWLAVVAGVVGLLVLTMGRGLKPLATAAVVLVLTAFVAAWQLQADSIEPIVHRVLFGLFACATIAAALLMISQRNPVYAALYFTVVVVAGCGLFLLLAAPFVAAAAVIVYAGAIVVTFLFVIMLAQQRGLTPYDQRFWRPLPAAATAGLLLATVLSIVNHSYGTQSSAEAVIRRLDNIRRQMELGAPIPPHAPAPTLAGRDLDALVTAEVEKIPATVARLLQKRSAEASDLWCDAWRMPRRTGNREATKAEPPKGEAVEAAHDPQQILRATVFLKDIATQALAARSVPATTLSPSLRDDVKYDVERSWASSPNLADDSAVRILGRTLWGDYLLGVEIAGSLLLVATIGAIAVNQRMKEAAP